MTDRELQREWMVEHQLRPRGIEDPRVLEAMAEIPRELFLPVDQAAAAYEDAAVPLSQGQTLSQPFMVAAMSQALQLTPRDRVLEIGTGSGYQTAVLSRLAAEVFTIEYLPELSRAAVAVLRELGCVNVRARVGDGSGGWPEEAPFDAILVTAGAPALPASLKQQVREDGGRIVIPVGPRTLQTLYRFVRHGTEVEREALMDCRFVPLVGEEGWRGETPE
ncbi:MAG: protein-L-isoaspartate(D-aspartate) O-methyltransferase [Gemmatimonadota bacterium]